LGRSTGLTDFPGGTIRRGEGHGQARVGGWGVGGTNSSRAVLPAPRGPPTKGTWGNGARPPSKGGGPAPGSIEAPTGGGGRNFRAGRPKTRASGIANRCKSWRRVKGGGEGREKARNSPTQGRGDSVFFGPGRGLGLPLKVLFRPAHGKELWGGRGRGPGNLLPPTPPLLGKKKNRGPKKLFPVG